MVRAYATERLVIGRSAKLHWLVSTRSRDSAARHAASVDEAEVLNRHAAIIGWSGRPCDRLMVGGPHTSCAPSTASLTATCILSPTSLELQAAAIFTCALLSSILPLVLHQVVSHRRLHACSVSCSMC